MKMNGIQASLLGLLICIVALKLSSAQIAKPGVCPPERFFNSSHFYPVKTNGCRSDSICPGNKKCCDDNGYKFCKPPAEERNGSCPANPNETTRRCDDMCTSDSECAPAAKCCFKGCGKTCLPSVEKKGSCGIEIHCFIMGRPHCDTDSGCPDDEKCCSRPCVQTCVKPQ